MAVVVIWRVSQTLLLQSPSPKPCQANTRSMRPSNDSWCARTRLSHPPRCYRHQRSPSWRCCLLQVDFFESELQRSKMRTLPTEKKWQLMQAKGTTQRVAQGAKVPAGYLSTQYFLDEMRTGISVQTASSLAVCLRNRVAYLGVNRGLPLVAASLLPYIVCVHSINQSIIRTLGHVLDR